MRNLMFTDFIFLLNYVCVRMLVTTEVNITDERTNGHLFDIFGDTTESVSFDTFDNKRHAV